MSSSGRGRAGKKLTKKDAHEVPVLSESTESLTQNASIGAKSSRMRSGNLNAAALSKLSVVIDILCDEECTPSSRGLAVRHLKEVYQLLNNSE